MKIIFRTLILLFLTTSVAYSQPVTENILFDNFISTTDNDLENYFSGNTLLTQITTNGITGGCLTTPTTESWGNNNAVYCSKYIDSTSYSNSTRISFKYDSTQLNSINYDRAVSIFLRPSADFNHYIIGSITSDKKIQVVSYFAANNPFQVNLLHNHWYEFILNTSYTTPAPVYQVAVDAQLNDLGITGLTPPIPAGNSSLTFTDSLLYVDTAVEVSFSGTLWGGASYIDNFHFEGMKTPNGCIISTGLSTLDSNVPQIYFSGNSIHIANNDHEMEYAILAVSGQVILTGKIKDKETVIPINALTNGVYLMRLTDTSDNFQMMKKLSIVK
ncbi:MAG TPA: hypothetical protein PKD91_01210 [Bacteroidia bacterium]|nr:hypothetical protein [Bacteroidia bacterium]